MSKKYQLPENEAQMASEPAATYAMQQEHTSVFVPMAAEDNSLFSNTDAPCQYSLDEVKDMLKKNIEDYKNGIYHTQEEVDRIMAGWY